MATLNDQFPSPYLAVADLQGQKHVVTIQKVTRVKIKNDDGEEITKACVYFDEIEKGFIVNKTNWQLIAAATGQDDDDNWTGYKIRLRPAKAEFKGKLTPCIRVDDEFVEPPGEQPKKAAAGVFGKKAEAAPAKKKSDDDDDIPF